MIKHSKTFFLLTYLLLALTTSAQHNFIPGYIVKTSGDTIKGLIDEGTETNNSALCNYKAEVDASVTAFLPNEIQGYGFITNKHYTTKNIQPKGAVVYYFLKYLVNGTTSLYSLNQPGLERYFIERGTGFYELTNDDISFDKDGVTYKKKSNRYIGTLKVIMTDTPQMFPFIESTDFKKRSLVNLLERYYTMVNQPNAYIAYRETKFVVPRQKIQFRIGASLGLGLSQMGYKSSIDYYKSYDPRVLSSNIPGLGNVPVTAVTSINIIPSLCLNINRGTKNSFQVELGFVRNTYKFNAFTVQTNRLTVPLMYRRGFGYRKKVEPFINGGICLGFNLETQTDGLMFTHLIQEKNGTQSYYVPKDEKVTNQNTRGSLLQPGLILGVGLTYDLNKRNTLEFELRRSIFHQKMSSDFDQNLSIQSKLNYWNNSLSVALSF